MNGILVAVSVIVVVSIVGGLLAPRLLRWDVRRHEPSVTMRLTIDATRVIAAFAQIAKEMHKLNKAATEASRGFGQMAEALRMSERNTGPVRDVRLDRQGTR